MAVTVGCPPRSTETRLPSLFKLTRAHRARFELGPRRSLGNSRAIEYTFLSAMVSFPVHWKLFKKPSKSAKNGSLLSPAAKVNGPALTTLAPGPDDSSAPSTMTSPEASWSRACSPVASRTVAHWRPLSSGGENPTLRATSACRSPSLSMLIR